MLYLDTNPDMTSAAAVAYGRVRSTPSQEALWPTTGPSGCYAQRSRHMPGAFGAGMLYRSWLPQRHDVGGTYSVLSQAGIEEQMDGSPLIFCSGVVWSSSLWKSD